LTGFIVTQRSRGDIGKAQSLILRSNSITYLDQHYNPKIFTCNFKLITNLLIQKVNPM
jgi:hypothetical protein